MKKKIISVVLVMTMVFALLAVSASARRFTWITSIALSGVPESLAIGQDVTAIQVTTQSEAFTVNSVTVYNSGDVQVTGTITDPGEYKLEVKLVAISQNGFDENIQPPEKATSISLFGSGQEECYVSYKYTIEGPTPTPGPTPGPDVDPDIDFSGLFGKIFDLIRWKKVTDDVKTFSILTVIFRIIEAIVEKLAANVKN